MKTIDEIRRENLLSAIKRIGTAAKLADLVGTAPAYLSQIKNQAPDSKSGVRKTMGDDIARRIEVELGESVGWMDRDHSSKAEEVDAAAQHQAPRRAHLQWVYDDEAEVLDGYRATDSDGRGSIRRLCKSVTKLPVARLVNDKG